MLKLNFGAVALMATGLAASANATTFSTADYQNATAGVQAMRELNLIVLGDLSSGHEVEGKAFIGGNVSGNAENFGIGNAEFNRKNQGFAANSRPTLTVGGNVSSGVHINNGAIGNTGKTVSSGESSLADVGGNVTGTVGLNLDGSIRVGGTFNGSNFNPSAAKRATYGVSASNLQAQDLAFVTQDASLANSVTGLAKSIGTQTSALNTQLTTLSNILGSLTANATLNTSDHNNINVSYDGTVASTGYAVININASDLLGYSGTLNFNLLGDGNGGYVTTLVNVIGANSGTAFQLNFGTGPAKLDQNVIWNFESTGTPTQTVSFGTEWFGSVLAPTATVSNNNAINGSVIAKMFNQGGEVHLGTFAGTTHFLVTTDTPPPGAVPEPASWMTMLMGFGIIGSLIRGKRRKGSLAAA